jgi:SPP1 gp7 family putative phage head morphogenesis protein
MTSIGVGYTQDLKSLFYRMRQAQLHTLMEGGWEEAIRHSKLDAMMGEPLWEEFTKDVMLVSRKYLTQTVDVVGDELISLFGDLKIGIDSTWSIWDTRAVELLERQINQGPIVGVSDTVAAGIREKIGDAIESGWTVEETADVLREQFNIAQNRATTIVRTEMNSAINESRIAGFMDVGIKRHEWLSSKDELVRETHRIDGEVREFGIAFSNGLYAPNDPGAPPEEVINCRCITLPVFEE